MVILKLHGSSRRLGRFAPSLFFHLGRAAMPHFAMEPVTTMGRTINRCVRKPIRIAQVTPSVVRIESVAAMYAGLHLGLGSHAGQGTRYGPKSVVVFAGFQMMANNQTRRNHIACNSKSDRLHKRIVYIVKLTQPRSMLAVATTRTSQQNRL